jgi:hypothetical protein
MPGGGPPVWHQPAAKVQQSFEQAGKGRWPAIPSQHFRRGQEDQPQSNGGGCPPGFLPMHITEFSPHSFGENNANSRN